jgi:hypothetical protein
MERKSNKKKSAVFWEVAPAEVVAVVVFSDVRSNVVKTKLQNY